MYNVQCIEYLRDVNPAGTVPVLIHNGHPVYESHEQIVYIDQAEIILLPHLHLSHKRTGVNARGAKADPKRSREEEGDGEVGQPGGHDHEVSHNHHHHLNTQSQVMST